MITGKDVYDVFSALVPLYVAMFLAYASVRWWKIFTPEQCSGINRFVAVFAIPVLCLKLLSHNNPYTMNYKFIAADSLQKLVILGVLFLWITISKKSSFDLMITLFSLSTLPNTLVMGIPLLRAMYGDFSASLMVQIVVFQSVVWNNLLLLMFEYRGARILITELFPDSAGSIASFRVDTDVVSLDGREPLQADAEIGDDGKLHVVVRKSSASSVTPRASNLTGVEIYSVQSFRELATRALSFNQLDLSWPRGHANCPQVGVLDDAFSLKSSKGTTPRTSLNFEDHEILKSGKISSRKEGVMFHKDQPHMFAWSSTASSPVNCVSATSNDMGVVVDVSEAAILQNASLTGMDEGDGKKRPQTLPPIVMTKLVVTMVWRKLTRNPNTYSSLLGIVWSLISFRWQVKMPSIVNGCISIISDTGLGMAMFSLGLFMASQPNIISCGKSAAAFSMAVRFLVGPAVIALTSVAIGLRGVLLHVAIVQAALPQGIVCFVLAKEYNVHADILSTSVTVGMVIALPITILYYVILGL
ncbi:auxin efflux carrier component 2-like [Juglans microcarpa x Juglans regia]|uniref:auxin efflux carrier component 2-like n=1 Tax=Juglans microcarpa x Juglans regia TaxID=2249226 RepID=UPI001B7F4F2D|nr:auxin efflux carrier component 2-like [Juglans microcarpa x Juglans regia]